MISSDFIRFLFSKKAVNHHFKSQPTAFWLRSVKAMGKAMKVMKATSAKRKVVKPLGKGSTKKPLGKGTKPMKSILKPNNLRKLGQLTLAERVQQISNTAEDEEEAAQELQQSMTPAEKSRHLCKKEQVGSSHQPFHKGSPSRLTSSPADQCFVLKKSWLCSTVGWVGGCPQTMVWEYLYLFGFGQPSPRLRYKYKFPMLAPAKPNNNFCSLFGFQQAMSSNLWERVCKTNWKKEPLRKGL